MAISEQEKQRLIALGAAKRAARKEKQQAQLEGCPQMQRRKDINLEEEKNRILQADVVEPDEFHLGLKMRLHEVNQHLRRVLEKGEKLNVHMVPVILDLLNTDRIKDARIAFKVCYEGYKYLIWRCWHFQAGNFQELSKAAYHFWSEILAYPEVQVTGMLIMTIMESGLICPPTVEILKNHKQKFVMGELSGLIVNSCKRYLKQGGYVKESSFSIEKWTEEQVKMLEEIVDLFQVADMRSLEQLAQDSAD